MEMEQYQNVSLEEVRSIDVQFLGFLIEHPLKCLPSDFKVFAAFIKMVFAKFQH